MRRWRNPIGHWSPQLRKLVSKYFGKSRTAGGRYIPEQTTEIMLRNRTGYSSITPASTPNISFRNWHTSSTTGSADVPHTWLRVKANAITLAQDPKQVFFLLGVAEHYDRRPFQ